METLHQAELPIEKKFSKRAIGIIFTSAILLGLGAALAIASALPTEQEEKFIEIGYTKAAIQDLQAQWWQTEIDQEDMNKNMDDKQKQLSLQAEDLRDELSILEGGENNFDSSEENFQSELK